jgi:RND family efflux transporter MFP subunit
MPRNHRPILFLAGLLAGAPARAELLADAPCQITASERSEVSALVPGVLAEVLVERGAHVSKGQLLARLHSEVEQAQFGVARLHAAGDAALRQRRARLAMAERTLARNRDLVTQHVISEQDLDQLRTERDLAQFDVAGAEEALAQAKAEMEAARAAVEVRELRSPIDGVVTERNAEPGERAGERPVLVIQRLDRLYAEAVLPAALHPGLRPGAKARVEFAMNGAPPRIGAVSMVDPVIDPKTDMFTIRVALDNTSSVLPTGIKCRIDPMAVP